MTFNSPEKANEKPARLIEEDHVFDETRTSGVGQQYAGNYLVTLKIVGFSIRNSRGNSEALLGSKLVY